MLIGMGLVKKVVIADYLGRTVVDPVFGVPQAYHAPDVLLAAYAYAAQIYCDFSGYTDIAIGLALLMGFIFPQNFRSPYRATGSQRFLAPLAHDAQSPSCATSSTSRSAATAGAAASPTATCC